MVGQPNGKSLSQDIDYQRLECISKLYPITNVCWISLVSKPDKYVKGLIMWIGVRRYRSNLISWFNLNINIITRLILDRPRITIYQGPLRAFPSIFIAKWFHPNCRGVSWRHFNQSRNYAHYGLTKYFFSNFSSVVISLVLDHCWRIRLLPSAENLIANYPSFQSKAISFSPFIYVRFISAEVTS